MSTNMTINRIAGAVVMGMASLGMLSPAKAQTGQAAPPAVGIMEATKRPITESNEFIGRIEATIVSMWSRASPPFSTSGFAKAPRSRRATCSIELERGPFEADLAAKKAQVAQLQATLVNAKLTTDRARTLLGGPAGQQSTYDAASPTSAASRRRSRPRRRRSTFADQSRLYRHPLADRRQDRPHRRDRRQCRHAELRRADHHRQPGPDVCHLPGFGARADWSCASTMRPAAASSAVVIKLRLPDGRLYDQTGKLDFVDNTIAQNTDTIYATRHDRQSGRCMTDCRPTVRRELTDGEFVTVCWKACEPVEVLAIPRAAVLSDQQGDYVYVVGADNKAEQRRIQLGQSTSDGRRGDQRPEGGRKGRGRGLAAGAARPAVSRRVRRARNSSRHEGLPDDAGRNGAGASAAKPAGQRP